MELHGACIADGSEAMQLLSDLLAVRDAAVTIRGPGSILALERDKFVYCNACFEGLTLIGEVAGPQPGAHNWHVFAVMKSLTCYDCEGQCSYSSQRTHVS